MANKSYHEVLTWASSFLKEHGKDPAAAKYLLLGRLGWSTTDWLLHLKEPVPETFEQSFKADIERLLADYPPQYLLGWCEFFDQTFKVNEATLIPRPETEELVALCLEKNNQPKKEYTVLDIGTGSGIIAITLKKNRPHWQVTATDISAAALEVAKENAIRLQADVTFSLGDLFEPISVEQKVDIIISNPPYIGKDEWQEMDESVRLYEPENALFAEKNGYEIYERLAKEAGKYLMATGQIFLEIGYQQGEQVKSLFQTAFPHKKVVCLPDLNGQDRMIWVY